MPASSIFTMFSALVALAAIPASAHIQMIEPPSFGSAGNPHVTEPNRDYNNHHPLSDTGSNFPCRGHLSKLNTPQGESVATWKAGSKQHFTTQGSAVHGGGSCQASLSVDGGKTFRVIKSIIGICTEQPTWEFNVPEETPSGDAIFAWTWFNNLGNREMYMNCAHVTIQGGGKAGGLDNRPEIFKANIGNGCSTVPSRDVLFPDPGVDVVMNSKNPVAPVGSCDQGDPGSRPAATQEGDDGDKPKTSGKPKTQSSSEAEPTQSSADHPQSSSGKKCKKYGKRRVRRHKRAATHNQGSF